MLSAAEVESFATRVLEAAGLAPWHARSVAEGLALANLRGVDSHGLVRLPQYTASIQAGEIEPDPDVRVVLRRGATALVDAGGGYGYAPSRLAMDTAVEIARELGVGVVGVRASHHFGMGAEYVLRAVEAGFVGWLTTTSSPVMPPWGGAKPVLGNNPIAWAIPRRASHPPIVLDMALSQVAYGRIRLAAAEGRPIPEGWALDEEGRPTTDAERALAAASLLPVGGYKGSGLAMVSEVLAGVMTGSPFASGANSHGRREGGAGHVLMALDPALFVSREELQDGVESLVAQVCGTPPAPGTREILLPGEIEQHTHDQRAVDGVPVSDELASALDGLASRLGVAAAAWARS